MLTLSKSQKYVGGAVIEIAPDGNETLIWKGTQAEVNNGQPTDSGTFVITATGKNPRGRGDESPNRNLRQGLLFPYFTPERIRVQ